MSGTGSYRDVAMSLVEAATAEERIALRQWTEALLEIRARDLGPIRKSRKAVAATHDCRAVWPFLKAAWTEKHRHGWDDRGLSSQVGLLGAAAGVLVFGGKWAGLAPLGDAASIPMWIVIGRGGDFAEIFLAELRRDSP